jgi:hypothetical protein
MRVIAPRGDLSFANHSTCDSSLKLAHAPPTSRCIDAQLNFLFDSHKHNLISKFHAEPLHLTCSCHSLSSAVAWKMAAIFHATTLVKLPAFFHPRALAAASSERNNARYRIFSFIFLRLYDNIRANLNVSRYIYKLPRHVPPLSLLRAFCKFCSHSSSSKMLIKLSTQP